MNDGKRKINWTDVFSDELLSSNIGHVLFVTMTCQVMLSQRKDVCRHHQDVQTEKDKDCTQSDLDSIQRKAYKFI